MYQQHCTPSCTGGGPDTEVGPGPTPFGGHTRARNRSPTRVPLPATPRRGGRPTGRWGEEPRGDRLHGRAVPLLRRARPGDVTVRERPAPPPVPALRVCR